MPRCDDARRGRSASLSADLRPPPRAARASLSSAPPLVNPPPQFVAATAARQLIAADERQTARPHPSRRSLPAVDISVAALALLNGFLDSLLFNVLLAARSTRLRALRPAVADVLKPRLARDVVAAADDELAEYLGLGDDDDDLDDNYDCDYDYDDNRRPDARAAGHFELERSWKLTRLKCMVYSRLGDMEEEDEDDHLLREGLDETAVTAHRPGRFARSVGHITPAAAIFLTSILEYLAENALVIIADNARARLAVHDKDDDDDLDREDEDDDEAVPPPPPLIMEDVDVEKIGLNPTLGRLWRTWRKNARPPAIARTLSRESLLRFTRKSTSRQSSIATVETLDEMLQPPPPPPFSLSRRVISHAPVSEDAEPIDPADVPLPGSDRDVEELESPRVKEQDEQDEDADEAQPPAVATTARSFRSRSLFLGNLLDVVPASAVVAPAPRSASELEFRAAHARSHSVPVTMSRATAVTFSKAPEPIVVRSKKEKEKEKDKDGDREPLAPMREDIELAEQQQPPPLRRTVSVRQPVLVTRLDSPEPGPYVDAREEPSSPVSSIHSGTIGVALGHPHSPLSPVSRLDSHLSDDSLDDHHHETNPRAPADVFDADQLIPLNSQPSGLLAVAPATHGLAVGIYPHAPVPIPERSPQRLYSQDPPSPLLEDDEDEEDEPDTIVETAFVSARLSQPPALTPLRELVAFADGTPNSSRSNISNSNTNNNNSNPSPSRVVSSRAASSSPFGVAKRHSTSAETGKPNNVSPSKRTAHHVGGSLPQRTGSLRSVSPGGRERAGVQRVSPPPPPPPPSNKSPSGTHRSRRSESGSSNSNSGGGGYYYSSEGGRRPITASSGSSQVSNKLKGLVVGRPTIVTAGAGTTTTTSTFVPESSSGSGSALLKGDGGSDLDQLIESDETLHYTLTPKTMREIEDPESPRWASVRNAAMAEGDAAGSGEPTVRSPTLSSDANGLRVSTTTTPVSRFPPRLPAVPQAREAKTDMDSVREFADFIKHTGPEPGRSSPSSRLYTPIVTTPAPAPLLQHPQPRFAQSLGSIASSPAGSRAQSAMSSRTAATASKANNNNRPRLEARSAVAPKDSQTSDLIDFIREGPPRAGGQHRIPRTVAPFRSTMDSDEFHCLSPIRVDKDGGFAPSATTSVSMLDAGSTVTRSCNSFNSRTGLLDATPPALQGGSNGGGGTMWSIKPQPPLGSVLDSPPQDRMGMPVRTRRKARDPYAIDSDSEDEHDLLSRGSRKQPASTRHEESLVDFLRSVTPPPSNDAPPQLLSVNMHVVHNLTPPPQPKPKSMKSRLMRTASTDKYPHPHPAHAVSSHPPSRSGLRPQKSFPANPSALTAAAAPAPPPIPAYRQQQQHPRRQSSVPNAAYPHGGYNVIPRAADEMRLTAHQGRAHETGTAALADFFRNTAPPGSVQTMPPSRPQQQQASKSGFGFSRVFLRRKKQVV
ncbi:hypothetical protein LOY87_005940 [Ophidiomyces ophidiicola]|nr:hypothetical protein LOY87_005940 [Ophidiomyces ophidiicola]